MNYAALGNNDVDSRYGMILMLTLHKSGLSQIVSSRMSYFSLVIGVEPVCGDSSPHHVEKASRDTFKAKFYTPFPL